MIPKRLGLTPVECCRCLRGSYVMVHVVGDWRLVVAEALVGDLQDPARHCHCRVTVCPDPIREFAMGCLWLHPFRWLAQCLGLLQGKSLVLVVAVNRYGTSAYQVGLVMDLVLHTRSLRVMMANLEIGVCRIPGLMADQVIGVYHSPEPTADLAKVVYRSLEPMVDRETVSCRNQLVVHKVQATVLGYIVLAFLFLVADSHSRSPVEVLVAVDPSSLPS